MQAAIAQHDSIIRFRGARHSGKTAVLAAVSNTPEHAEAGLS